MKTKINSQNSKVILLLILMIMGNTLSCQQNKEKAENKVELTTTIHEAAFMNNIEQMKAHIEGGSDLDQLDQYGSTALNIAATFDKPEIAQLLIDAGADLTVAAADGTTPLHMAVFLCRTDIVKMLLASDADTEAVNGFGATPLMSVMAPFDQMLPIYEQMNRDLGMLGFKVDYDFLESEREVVADLILDHKANK